MKKNKLLHTQKITTQWISLTIFLFLTLLLIGVLCFSLFLDRIFVVQTPTISAMNFSYHNKLLFDDNYRGTVPQSVMTVVLFSDFSCPSCIAFFSVFREITLDFPQVNFMIKHLPSDDVTRYAAYAYECAQIQKRGMDAAEQFFGAPLERASDVDSVIYVLGLNSTDFRDCMNSEVIHKLVLADEYQAVNLNIKGTPTLFVNGIKIEGSVDYLVLQELIKHEYYTLSNVSLNVSNSSVLDNASTKIFSGFTSGDIK